MNVLRFKQLFLPCHDKMFRVAGRLSGNVQAAEDLVQEAFLRLWLKRNELNIVGDTEAFCVTVVRNLFFDQQRKRHLPLADSEPGMLRVATDSNVETEVETADESAIVMRLIDRLPQQQRRIITMKDVEGASYDEIERLTGLTAVNIRVVLSRARKQIRQQMKTITDGQGEGNKTNARTVL